MKVRAAAPLGCALLLWACAARADKPDRPDRPVERSSTAAIDITDYGASGSVLQTKGSMAAGGHDLTVENVRDFKRGQGVEINHCGAPCMVAGKPCAAPAAPTLSVVAAPGIIKIGAPAVHYAYKLVDATFNGGLSPAGVAVETAAGVPKLDGVNLNHLGWHPSGAAGKIVCRQTGSGAYAPIALVADSGSFDDTNFQDARLYYAADQVPNFYPDKGGPYVPIWGLAACDGPGAPENLVTTIKAVNPPTLALADASAGGCSGAMVNHTEDSALAAANAAAGTRTIRFPAGGYNFFQLAPFTTSIDNDQNFDASLVSYAARDAFVFYGADQLRNVYVVKPSLLGANLALGANMGSLLLSRVYAMGGWSGFDDHGLMLSGAIEFSFFLGSRNGLSINPYNLVLLQDEFYAVPDGTAAGFPWLLKNGVLCTGPAPNGEWITATNVDIEYLTHGGAGFNGCGKNGALVVNASGDLYEGDFDASGVNIVAGGRTVISGQPISKHRAAVANPGNYPVVVDGGKL